MEETRGKDYRRHKPTRLKEQHENNKQFLGFDEVNFEQEREPYKERVKDNLRNNQNRSQGSPERRN